MHGEAIASRDITAQLIPTGEPHVIPEGSRVLVTQALGGTFTVMTERGYLARVAGADAEAIGQQPLPPPEPSVLDDANAPLLERARATLRTVYDPEIPVDIVELGLISRCEVTGEAVDRIEVDMTLTAPGCGMSDIIKAEIEQKLAALDGAGDVVVTVVFDPPWDPSMMSEAARLETGIF